MGRLAFRQVDVFTRTPFLGNPVAVVLGAEGLDDAAMQRIACWTNLSETTFVLPSRVADYRLRIFTPRQELPFAGHPTVGSAHAVLEAGVVARKPRLVQECAAGLIELEAQPDGAIFFRGPEARIERLEAPASVSIPWRAGSSAARVDVGPVWLVGEVADARTLAALKPDLGAIGAWSAAQRATGVTLFAASGEGESAIHVRSFAPNDGVPEDPVCGSGNLSVAAWLREQADKRFGAAYVARQGMALGRDGRVQVRIGAGALHVGGHAVTCVEGFIAA